jgi:serine/threonine-protein kinase
LDALASAHDQGVIHQDVKPANILLTAQMRAKVADFGISRFANTDITSISSSMGTPNYMSPEQCRGGPVDHRADLFAAGATLFEMVAAERAFGGRSSGEVTNRIMNERLPLLPAAVRHQAPRLQFVLERAMGKQPEDRFDSAQEMAEAMRQVLASCTVGEATATSIMPSLIPAAPPPSTAAPSDVSSPIHADVLRVLEQKLVPYLGPIARIMVRSAAGRARTVDALCAQLAAAVPEGRERESFRRDVAPLLRPRPPALDDVPSRGSIGSLHEADLERVQRALTQYVGPIARVLVRRAARDASSIEGLWEALSKQIDLSSERAAFLRQRDE